MTTGHGDVVEKNIGVGVTAGSYDIAIESESTPRLRASPDYQHCGISGNSFDNDGDVFLDGIAW
jgi:hypothetical protein